MVPDVGAFCGGLEQYGLHELKESTRDLTHSSNGDFGLRECRKYSNLFENNQSPIRIILGSLGMEQSDKV